MIQVVKCWLEFKAGYQKQQKMILGVFCTILHPDLLPHSRIANKAD
jgi:hypothetical protein